MVKLHIGSGSAALPGWINIDNQPYHGVDRVLDVREGLPFAGVQYIFCEHFVEHLTLTEGLVFLGNCRRALGNSGVLRISTPNLDWIWLTHYRHPADLNENEALTGCLELNRAFHGWGHKFLYNQSTLVAALRSSGFADFKRYEFGESDHPDLRELETHEKSPDHPDASHVLVIEASGFTTDHEADFLERTRDYIRDEEIR